MNIVETVKIQAHNDLVGCGRAITEVLKKHVGRRFQKCIIDGWTATEFNFTGKPLSPEIADSLIKCRLHMWRHGKFINMTTERVVLSDVTVEEAAPCDWSTQKGGGDQTYTFKVEINDFPDNPEYFMARVQESNSFTNPGDSVRWHDVLGKTIRGVSNDHMTEVVTKPIAVAKTMFIGELPADERKKLTAEERAFKISDYIWTYC